MTYIITVIFCLAGFVWKKSNVVFWLMLIWMWILFGWNTDNIDFQNYVYSYYNAPNLIGHEYYEYGYRLLCVFGHMLGLDYQGFLKLVSAFGLLLIASTINKYSKNPSYVLSLYILTTYFANIVQLRSFLASAIVIFAIRYLVKNSKRNNIIFIILTLIASTFHFSALFYVAFSFIKSINKKVLIILVLIFSLFSYFIAGTGLVQQLILGITDSEKVYDWVSGNNVNSYVFNSLLQILTLIYVTIFAKIYFDENKVNIQTQTAKDIRQNKYTETVYLISWIMLTATVLYLLHGTFSRIFVGIIPLLLIFFSNTIPNHKYSMEVPKKVFTRGAAHLTYAVLIFWYTVWRYSDYTIIPILENNALFNSF